MNFSPPTQHQKIYLLGACAVLIIAAVFLAKNGTLRHNEANYTASGTATTGKVPVAASGTKPLIPPIANSTAQSKSSTPAKTTTTTAAAPSPLDSITASSYLVGNAATGQIYLSKDITLENGLASISKLFTAIVAQENMDPDEEIQITPAMLAVYPNSYGIELGEKMTLKDLLYGMILQSNDNIAEGIAMAYSSPTTYITAPAGTTPSEASFVQKMNTLAGSIGLTHTQFQDASGLVEGNVTNATDLFKFAQYLYASQPGLLAITRTYSYEVATTTTNFGHDFVNIDPFVGDPEYLGGKTGRTDDAGETMLSIFNIQAKNGTTYPIVIIVLHSALSQRQNDSSELYVQATNILNKLP